MITVGQHNWDSETEGFKQTAANILGLSKHLLEGEWNVWSFIKKAHTRKKNPNECQHHWGQNTQMKETIDSDGIQLKILRNLI